MSSVGMVQRPNAVPVSCRSRDVIILEMSGDDTTLKRKKLVRDVTLVEFGSYSKKSFSPHVITASTEGYFVILKQMEHPVLDVRRRISSKPILLHIYMSISGTHRCTTTPTVRRRRRTKEELLKAASALDSANILLPQPEPSATSIPISAYAGAAAIVVYSHNNAGQDLTGEPVPMPPSLELPAEIVQDLFQSMSEFCL